MIIGSFPDIWSPYVRGLLVVPRLAAWAHVRFLIDTGSTITLIHPNDARRAGIRFDQLRGQSGTRGIGGSAETFVEPAVLYFNDADGVTEYSYRIDIAIAEPDADNYDYPSLLGMDIISCWYTECDPTNDILQFTVRRIL